MNLQPFEVVLEDTTARVAKSLWQQLSTRGQRESLSSNDSTTSCSFEDPFVFPSKVPDINDVSPQKPNRDFHSNLDFNSSKDCTEPALLQLLQEHQLKYLMGLGTQTQKDSLQSFQIQRSFCKNPQLVKSGVIAGLQKNVEPSIKNSSGDHSSRKSLESEQNPVNNFVNASKVFNNSVPSRNNIGSNRSSRFLNPETSINFVTESSTAPKKANFRFASVDQNFTSYFQEKPKLNMFSTVDEKSLTENNRASFFDSTSWDVDMQWNDQASYGVECRKASKSSKDCLAGVYKPTVPKSARLSIDGMVEPTRLIFSPIPHRKEKNQKMSIESDEIMYTCENSLESLVEKRNHELNSAKAEILKVTERASRTLRQEASKSKLLSSRPVVSSSRTSISRSMSAKNSSKNLVATEVLPSAKNTLFVKPNEKQSRQPSVKLPQLCAKEIGVKSRENSRVKTETVYSSERFCSRTEAQQSVGKLVEKIISKYQPAASKSRASSARSKPVCYSDSSQGSTNSRRAPSISLYAENQSERPRRMTRATYKPLVVQKVKETSCSSKATCKNEITTRSKKLAAKCSKPATCRTTRSHSAMNRLQL